MELTVIIHGVTVGVDFLGGTPEDRRILSGFYHGKYNKESTLVREYVVSPANIEGKPYIYYTYFLGGNLRSFNGRSGAYFAITLKIGMYMEEIIQSYRIIEFIFDKHILGKVIEIDGTGGKIMVEDLSKHQPLLKEVDDDIGTLFSRFLSPNHFKNILVSKFSINSGFIRENILDVTDQQLVPLIKSGRTLYLSREYPSQREKRLKHLLEQKFDAVLLERDDKIQELEENKRVDEKSIQQLKSQVDSLKRSLGKERELVAQLKREVSGERARMHSTKQMLQDLLQSLNQDLSTQTSSESSMSRTAPKCLLLRDSSNEIRLLALSITLCVVIIVLILILIFR